MFKFNWRNLVENLIITIVVFAIGAYAGHKVTKITANSTVEILAPLLQDAINKETVTNSIHNAINNNFDKIKKSDSLKLIIAQEPYNDNRPNTEVTVKENCAVTKADYSKLSDGQKKRLNRWINE